VGPLAGGGDVGGGEGLGLGGSGGGGGGASFFGREAQGNRFAYIVDVSSSMEGGRIQSLQRELDRSIDGLLETSEFQVVQYSTDSQVVTEKDSWNQASPAGKRSAHARIGLMVANGSTNPLPAFEIIFRMRPRPDAIYFLTDGEFPDDIAEKITTLNRQLKIPIHCICLESQEGELRMKQIAKVSRGTYTYVPPKN
ncbi:MAG: VWA domain-containing protein, partial [Phycisphaerales bacterium]